MCQGKMPMSVRQRYEQMAQKQPEKFIPMIENFDQALSHPSLEWIYNHLPNNFQSFNNRDHHRIHTYDDLFISLII